MDCVLSYHLNPATCGVARFNSILAQQLGVPLLGIFDEAALRYRAPLISLKAAEFAPSELSMLARRLETLFDIGSPRLFLHAFTDTPIEKNMLERAAAIYCGNPEVRATVAQVRPDAQELWCPGTIMSHDRFEPVELSVFSFGMAHKVRSEYYVRLHDLLEATGKRYALYLSTALHENTSFEESFNGAFDGIRRVFGTRVHFLGFLSDAAVYNYLLDCTYFAAFFETGVRSNNTSVNTAMACGAVVITNRDHYSPVEFEHGTNVLDIERLERLPVDRAELDEIGHRARLTATDVLGWGGLIKQLTLREASVGQVLPVSVAAS